MAFGLRAKPVEPQGDARRGVRQDMLVPATITLGAGDTVSVTVENLSASGFRVTIPGGIVVGTLFRIGLMPGRARHARVVWQDGDSHGCEFLAPLSPLDIPDV